MCGFSKCSVEAFYDIYILQPGVFVHMLDSKHFPNISVSKIVISILVQQRPICMMKRLISSPLNVKGTVRKLVGGEWA